MARERGRLRPRLSGRGAHSIPLPAHSDGSILGVTPGRCRRMLIQTGVPGMLRPGVLPPRPGLYLMDMVPDDETKWGFANINDNATIVEQIACGAQIVLFSTGRGSVVGSAISPVIKICANPETYRRLSEDTDIDAGRILEGRGRLAEVGAEITDPAGRGRRPGQGRGARPPGVHPRLQVVRAAGPELFAGVTDERHSNLTGGSASGGQHGRRAGSAPRRP